MHRPGIEPGPPAWQASILPLNQRCRQLLTVIIFNAISSNEKTMLSCHGRIKKFLGVLRSKYLAPGEARTHNPGISLCTVYKYRALTDCATGANCQI